MATKCATFAFFGPPNAGKSTLLNALIGEKIAPVHRKPQMTRKNLLGIYTDATSQFLFVDTPGFHESELALNKELNLELSSAVKDAEFVLVLIDVAQPYEASFWQHVASLRQKKPVLLVLNKTDLPAKVWKVSAEELQKRFPGASLVSVSALTGEGLDALKTVLRDMSPESPFLYPEDEMTTATLREITANIVLEKVMEYLGQEIPYQVAIEVEEYKEAPERDSIQAAIVVNRDSQKGMVIGKGGAMIKKIGTAARTQLEEFLQKKVQLKLFVKVDKDWIKKTQKIRDYYGFARSE